jgi:mRNA interferase RelE/StbE
MLTPSKVATQLPESRPRPRYRLAFETAALAEWKALDGSVKEPLRKLLKKRLEQPRLPGAELHGELSDCYKIKLRKQGYRLVYRVMDQVLIVMVLAVDKREDSAAYVSAAERIKKAAVRPK